LQTIREVFQRNKEQAQKSYPVRLRAVVTYSDREWGILFVQDDTGGAYLNVHGITQAFPLGAQVQVEAVTGGADLSAVLLHPKIKVLGRGQMPPPAKWTLRELDGLVASSQWVETRGVLRPTNQPWERISYRLVDGPVEAVIVVPQPDNADAERLIGSTARVRGVCGDLIGADGKRIGVQLFVPNTDNIIIEDRAPSDPFASSPRPIGTLTNADAEPRLVHLQHVRGEVTWGSPGTFFLADMSGAICVQGKKTLVGHAGEIVDVAGFPTLGEYGLSLADSQVRRVTDAPAGERAAPLRLSAAEVLKASIHGRLVKLQARLIGHTEDATQHIFLLQDGQVRFSAVLPKVSAGARVASLPNESNLELTGVSVIGDATPQQPRSLLILIESPADLAQIEGNRLSPIALWIVGAVALLAIISLVWIGLLRQRVREQTATLRARLEREAELESVYRRLFQRNLAGVSRTSLGGRILDCNPALATMFCYARREDLIGQEIVGTHISPADHEAFVAQLTAEKEISNREMRLRRRDGNELWVLENANLVQDADSSASVIEGTLLNITERKQAEEARRESEKLFRGAFDQATTGMLVTATDGTLTKANSAFCAIVGYAEAELLQHKFVDFIHPEDRGAYQELAWRMLAGEVAAPRAEKRYVHKSGSIGWAEISPFLIHDSAGRPLYFIIHVADITQRRQIATQLQRARDAAVAASTAKSQFLANMSHEIRTPMNGILGMVDMALETDLTREQREYLGMARASAHALLGVINDVLDFSKVEAGRMDLNPIPFKLCEHLARCVKPLALRAHQKGLEITLDIHPDVPDEVIADPIRLQQILINLVGNAVKFTEEGEVGLEVEVKFRDPEQAELHFVIRDTGIGIAPENLKIIFDPFSQADSSTTRRFGGTGLGLTISSRLVEMMHGQIWVESQPGKGSSFHFTALLALAGSEAPGQTLETPNLDGAPVLVVDDNSTSRRVLGEMLSRWGMKPSLAASGPEALTLLSRVDETPASPALLLLDADMPGMGGFELFVRIRKQTDLGARTILMLTATGQHDGAIRCQELGIAAYLVKPILAGSLLEALRNLMVSASEPAGPNHLLSPHLRRESPRQLRVLLAEDSEVNQVLVARMIEKRGHQVRVANNGREVLEALARNPFDLVLMDVQMPEMDGFEAVAAIRTQEKRTGAHLPIIAMTAHALKGDRERCLNAGMDGYIAKPIQAKELFELIDMICPQAPENLSQGA
jgi:PAS domain S-box-containing protein